MTSGSVGFGPVPLDIPVVLSREDARRLAEQELAKAKYGGLPDWLIDFLREVGRMVARLTEALLGSSTGGGSLSPVVIVVALLLLAAVGVIIWRVGLPRFRHRRPAEEISVDPTRSPADYRQQADGLAAEQRWREAIAGRFRAVVRALEERTVLDVRPARTATEVAHSASVLLPDQRPALTELAMIFNDAWYGEHPPEPERYERICALDALITEAARHVDLSVAPPPGTRGRS